MLIFAQSHAIDDSEGRAPTVTDGDSLIRTLEDLKVGEAPDKFLLDPLLNAVDN